jgi:hypothetical protein
MSASKVRCCAVSDFANAFSRVALGAREKMASSRSSLSPTPLVSPTN